jgi:hypothetical protein
MNAPQNQGVRLVGGLLAPGDAAAHGKAIRTALDGALGWWPVASAALAGSLGSSEPNQRLRQCRALAMSSCTGPIETRSRWAME